MTYVSEKPSRTEEGKACPTGSCGMKICSPCAMMKLVMLGILIVTGIRYFVG